MAASRWPIDTMRRHDRPKRRIAGAIGARFALPIAFAAIAFVGVGRAGDMNTVRDGRNPGQALVLQRLSRAVGARL